MAHFAQIDEHNNVIQVIVLDNLSLLDDTGTESETVGAELCQSLFGEDTKWVQTSYSGRIRKNYAGIGFQYDEVLDAFVPPQPFPSWVLNTDSCVWEPPTPYPADGGFYRWDEPSLSWIQEQQ